MVSGAVTLLRRRVAVVAGQVASAMVVGSAQLTLTVPKKLSVPTKVTVAMPECPGAAMVTFGIGVEILLGLGEGHSPVRTFILTVAKVKTKGRSLERPFVYLELTAKSPR
jgi:hypothetical protein